jgi:hypothetical protein
MRSDMGLSAGTARDPGRDFRGLKPRSARPIPSSMSYFGGELAALSVKTRTPEHVCR